LSNANHGERSNGSATQQRPWHRAQSALSSDSMSTPASARIAADVAILGARWRGREKNATFGRSARPRNGCMNPPSVPPFRALDDETADRRERDLARTSDTALVAYEAKWRARLERLQRRYPPRWKLPGLSNEEVLDLLCLHLIEVLRGGDPELLGLESPGRPWGLLIAARKQRALRQAFRVAITPHDLAEVPSYREAPDQEQAFLSREEEWLLTQAGERAKSQLSRPQRRWLAALELSAQSGEFFAASDEPNLSAASRILGKNRSSALRAYRELQARYSSELSRLK
jgi:hypothetical protein